MNKVVIVVRASPRTARDHRGPPGAEERGVAEGSVPSSLDECQASAGVLCQWKKGKTYGELGVAAWTEQSDPIFSRMMFRFRRF